MGPTPHWLRGPWWYLIGSQRARSEAGSPEFRFTLGRRSTPARVLGHPSYRRSSSTLSDTFFGLSLLIGPTQTLNPQTAGSHPRPAPSDLQPLPLNPARLLRSTPYGGPSCGCGGKDPSPGLDRGTQDQATG
ncbi:hypothetical protein H920_15711 [Fukomys damarensis]|uniref:Uncharacterized protein n=1 Tax=Fukomys damarensis TaxID=885580 RepID=A0A091CW95_FUKDA|nr:hypothetical protein H920_15711 [Fukomys damarensis]